MTSDNSQKARPERFSTLMAVPHHRRAPTGIKGVAASLYIARRRTLAVSTAVVLAAFAGTAVLSYTLPSGAQEDVPAPVVDMARTLQEEVPSLPVMPTPDEVARPVVPGWDKTASVADDEIEGVSAPAPSVEVAEVGTPMPQEAPQPAVRLIIPVTEAMTPITVPPAAPDGRLAGVPAELAAPAVAAVRPEPEHAAEPTADALPLPVERIPSEADVEAFFRMPAKAEGAAPAPVEENLEPTIVLPEAPPVPVARPATPITPIPAATSGKVEFRIVQGPGIKSGFWLGNKEDPTSRRFFVVVAPYLEDGTRTSWKFTNIADAQKVDTDRMAVEVTEEAFAALATETKEHGRIRQPVLGTGEIGKEKIAWKIASEGNLLAGWDREKK